MRERDGVCVGKSPDCVDLMIRGRDPCDIRDVCGAA